jgi:DoxX-like family
MFTAYVVVTVVAAAVTTFAAANDFIRPRWLLANMTNAGVPRSWLVPLGALKAAGALGLLAGLGVPSPTFALAGTRLPTRRRFFCWPWARWGCAWPRPERGLPRAPGCSRDVRFISASASRQARVRRMVASAGTAKWSGASWRAPSAARTGWGASATHSAIAAIDRAPASTQLRGTFLVFCRRRAANLRADSS